MVVFFSAVSSVLYYVGVMQVIIKAIAILLQIALNTTPIESFATAAHIFIGQVCGKLFFWVLIDFSLTVKAATLIFISGRGSAISSVKADKSGSKMLKSFWGLANVRVFYENPNRMHTELTFINP